MSTHDTPRPDLDAIQARVEAATSGPWEVSRTADGGPAMLGVDVVGPPTGIRNAFERPEDAAFIAAARTDIPALLAYIKQLEAQEVVPRPDLSAIIASLQEYRASLDMLLTLDITATHDPAARERFDAAERTLASRAVVYVPALLAYIRALEAQNAKARELLATVTDDLDEATAYMLDYLVEKFGFSDHVVEARAWLDGADDED